MSRAPAQAGAVFDADVVVVGAGVAGLAAAGHLRACGLGTVLLEAQDRVGGRAHTTHPAALNHALFDRGASWLHDAEHNPLLPMARARGIATAPDPPWDQRLHLLQGNAGESDALGRAWSRWETLVSARADEGPDISLAEAGDALAAEPWTATIEAFEGAIIAAADADWLSLRDWQANALDGRNDVPANGMGDLVQRALGRDAGPVAFGVRVSALDAAAPGLRIATTQGTLRAAACILTVSTGVLRGGGIGFSPGLPDPTLAALNGLPMGLLSKIAAPLGPRLSRDYPPGATLLRRLAERGGDFLSALLSAGPERFVTGFVGGRLAWELAARPEADSLDYLRAALQAGLGYDGLDGLAPCVVTDWGTDPHFLGAYAYATPGCAGARAALAEPIWDGRLHIAGEATATDGMAGTVAGAFTSGRRAARQVCAYLGANPAR
jgi:monoamine oxidase